MKLSMRLGVVYSVLLAFLTCSSTLAEALVLEPASAAYSYATVSDHMTVLEMHATLGGSLAANHDVRLKSDSHVTGDARSTRTIDGDGQVDGQRLEGADPISVPTIPGLDELRSLADRIVQGPWIEPNDQVIDDFVFVEGNVHFQGMVVGQGTVVAAGDIRFDGAHATSPDSYLSLIAAGDVRFAMGRTFRGVVRAARDIDVEMGVSIEGVLLAGRNVHLKRNSTVSWLPPDRDPPVLELQSPLPLQYMDTNTTQPEIILHYEDDPSGVDTESVALYWDDIEITVLCDTNATSAQCELPNQFPDVYLLRVEISDLAGNETSQDFEIEYRRDDEAPTLVVTSPQDDALVNTPALDVTGTVSDEGGIQLVRVEGELVDLDASGSFQTQVTLEEGSNSIYVAALDIFDRLASEFLYITLDTVPPTLDLQQPTPGVVTTNTDALVVRGEVDDDVEFDRVEVDGDEAPLEYDRFFSVELNVPPQGKQVTITAFDRAGNQTSELLDIRRYELPVVSIESHGDGQRIQTDPVSISGSVSPDVTQVLVNGLEATVDDGSFVSQPIEVGAGSIIQAVATTDDGFQAVDVVRLTRDVSPPEVTILEPRPGSEVLGSSTAVLGLVRDAGTATLGDGDVEVRVNGVLAQVRNGSFFAPTVPILTGTQNLTVVATDSAGRIGTATIRIESDAIPPARIIKTSGDLQMAGIGESLAEPLVATVTGPDGQPKEGVPVVFRVARGNGALDDGARLFAAVTDASGTAAAPFRLGTRAGVGNHVVEVSSPGLATQRFHASAAPGDAAGIYVDSGDQQAGLAGRKLPHPLVVAVTDSGFNRRQGVPVTFRVARGGGQFPDGSTEAVVMTNSDGVASADLVLGLEDGTVNNVVDAFLEDHPERLFVAFGASGKAGGPSSETTISGIVLDNSDQPMPGVEVYLKGHPSHHTTTGPDGRFLLEEAPVGALLMEIEGATTDRPGAWPHLEFELTTVPGRDNTVGMPIYLVELDASMGVDVSETEGGRIEVPSLPGFALDIAPGSVTFPDGSRSGRVFVSQVHADKVPMVPNFGQQPKFVLTIQPAGAHFDPPARMSLPNTDGLAPGEITEMYSFDHDLGRFVGIGTASVTEDATQVVSDPGAGVIKAGWHCGGNPSARGTTYDCPTCQICNGSQCVPGCTLADSGNLFRFDEPGSFAKTGCDDCVDTRCRKNSRCTFLGCVGDEPQIASLEITQANGEPVTDVIYEDSNTTVEFRADVDKGNCDLVLLSWDLEAKNPVTGDQFKRSGDGVNPFQAELPFEARYTLELTADCGGCNSTRVRKSFLAHRLFVDFELAETDIEISDDGKYSENAPVKVKVISSVTEEVATSFSGELEIFEDDTQIYMENSGTLPSTVMIESGLGNFCAKSLSEGTSGGTEPLPARVRTSSLPLRHGSLSIPQWVKWKEIDPGRASTNSVDWAEALNSDILAASIGDLATVFDTVGEIVFRHLPGRQGDALFDRYRINIFVSGTRINELRTPPCHYSDYPGFIGVATHEARHVYQHYLRSRGFDDDDDLLPAIVDVAPFDKLVDSSQSRDLCIYYTPGFPTRQGATYQGDSIFDQDSFLDDPFQTPAPTSWARETDASLFAELHANTLLLSPQPYPDLSTVCE